MRPIDADALVAEQCGQCDGACEMFDEEKCLSCKADCHCDLREAIDNAPTLDLAPIKQADWLEHGCSTFCTRCGEKPLYDYFGKLKLSNYCPNCGAKMDGGKTDENNA